MASCTVEKYLMVLTSKLTQYDVSLAKREMKRGGRANIYRLGHFLEAAGKVREDMGDAIDKGDEAALARLKAAISKRFENDFPPAKNVLKQIGQGRCSIVGR